MSEMLILDRTGHNKTAWDANNADEVATAREMFNTMTASGRFRAFRPGADGRPGVRMDTFDPTAAAMIMVPHVQGG